MTVVDKADFEAILIEKTLEPEEESKELIKVKIDEPDAEGNFNVKFNRDIRLPTNFTQWTSENEGADKLQVEYLPSEETQTFMYDLGIEVKMRWKVVDLDKNSTGRLLQEKNLRDKIVEVGQIKVKLDFTEPQLVSKTDQDSLKIEIQEGMFDVETRYATSSNDTTDF